MTHCLEPTSWLQSPSTIPHCSKFLPVHAFGCRHSMLTHGTGKRNRPRLPNLLLFLLFVFRQKRRQPPPEYTVIDFRLLHCVYHVCKAECSVWSKATSGSGNQAKRNPTVYLTGQEIYVGHTRKHKLRQEK